MRATKIRYGDKIRVVDDILVTGALMPAKGSEGVVVDASNPGKIACQFQTPYPLAGGGEALHDDNCPKGHRVSYATTEIEVVGRTNLTRLDAEFWARRKVGPQLAPFLGSVDIDHVVNARGKADGSWKPPKPNQVSEPNNTFVLLRRRAPGEAVSMVLKWGDHGDKEMIRRLRKTSRANGITGDNRRTAFCRKWAIKIVERRIAR